MTPETLEDQNKIYEIKNPFQTDYEVIWNSRVIAVIPAGKTIFLVKPMAEHAAKYLVDKLIIGNEKAIVPDDRNAGQQKEVDGFPKVFDQPIRDKYLAQILKPATGYAPQNVDIRDEGEKARDLADELNGIERNDTLIDLNEDPEARKAELEDLKSNELRDLANEYQLDTSNITKKSDLIDKIVEFENK